MIEISNKAAGKPLTIAPLILLPILECVFEQVGQQPGGDGRLQLNLEAAGKEFSFSLLLTVEPPMTGRSLAENHRLTQIRKHLQSLYPDAHRFTMREGPEFIHIELQIRLKELPIQASPLTNTPSMAL